MLIGGTKWFHGIKGQDFQISLEYNEQLVFVHMDCQKMNTKVFREMKRFLEEGDEFFKTVGYKAIFTTIPIDNKEILRLDTMLGFVPFIQVDHDKLVLIYGEK